jgi:tRNA (cmo5U34)-methyltransferase
MTDITDFSFRDHAHQFDTHIWLSIPGYEDLRALAVELAPRFISSGSNVYDVGCSTGTHLRSIHDKVVGRRVEVHFHGVDIESKFSAHWLDLMTPSLTYANADARGLLVERASFVLSLFTIQFLSSADKLPMLTRIHEGLIDGGCFLIAEKVLAQSGRMQDALSFPYYDFKQSNGFTADEILTKERSLRGQMTLWTETEMETALRRCGFQDVQRVWGYFPFFCWLALK